MSNLRRNTVDVPSSVLYGKSTKDLKSVQANSEVFTDLANQAAVKAEIGDVLETIDDIVRKALSEVLERKGADTLKYEMTSMFATDLNATIKSMIIKEIDRNPSFGSKIKIRKNRGSIFFIVKDKYAVFIKKLNGKLNKPNSYPTANSVRTFSGELFVAGHIPFLFVGPNPKKGDGTYVTSLVNRKEVNWTSDAVDLFNYNTVEVPIAKSDEETTLNNVEVNKDLVRLKRKAK